MIKAILVYSAGFFTVSAMLICLLGFLDSLVQHDFKGIFVFAMLLSAESILGYGIWLTMLGLENDS